MKNLFKFLLLAVVGFMLGAGLAWMQTSKEWRETTGNRSGDIAASLDLSEAEQFKAVGEGDAYAAGGTAQDAYAIEDAVETPQEEVAGDEGHMDHADHMDHAGHMAADANEVAADVAADIEDETTATPVDGEEPGAVAAGSGVGGAFSLTDHNGNKVTEGSWPGKYKLVFFGFTHCPDICPTALDKMTAALEQLGGAAEKVQPLFITVDPARDTPDVMKEYMANYHPSFVGLTGSHAEIKQAQSAYKVYAAKATGGDAEHYLMDHSAYAFLMSPDDEMLEIIRSDDTAASVAEKVEKHLK